MNKIYILATALFLGANTNAQQLVDFEAVNLAPESYADGSAGNGAFVFTQKSLFPIIQMNGESNAGILFQI